MSHQARGRRGGHGRYDRDDRSNGSRHGPPSISKWGFRKLEALAGKAPKDVLVTVSQTENGFLDLLNEQELASKPDWVCLVLEISCKACSCSELPKGLLAFMGNLKGSSWMRFYLSTYLAQVSFLSPQKAQRPITNAIRLFKMFLEKMPNSVCDYLCSITMISSAVTSLGLTSLDGEIEELERMKDVARSDLEAMNSAPAESEAASEEDIQDFRKLSVFPSVSDVDGQKKPFFEKNQIRGGYKDVLQYLDRQFRLLKEDLVAPIRSGIAAFRENSETAAEQRVLTAYQNVHILYPVCSNEGVAIRVQFDVRPFRQVRWEQYKRLIYGSLVCLTADDFKTFIFAAVTNRDVDMLKLGMIDLCCNTLLDNERLQSKAESTFLMIESPAYFEAYRHVLRGLQEMADSQLPFAEQIVHCRFGKDLPKYLKQEGKPVYNLACLETRDAEDSDLWGPDDNTIGLHVSLQDSNTWPSPDTLGLNSAQFEGLKHCFMQSLSVIQGPPGTGKTYLGLKVVQSLLENRRVWMESAESKINSPLLVVCYTNHALDQFLLGIHKSHRSGKMVRIGGQSKNEHLSEFSIRSLRRKYREERRLTADMHKARMDARSNFQRLRNHIDEGVAQLQACDYGILHETMLRELMSEEHWQQLIGQVSHFSGEFTYGRRSAMVAFLELHHAAKKIKPMVPKKPHGDDSKGGQVEDDAKSMTEQRMVDDGEEGLIDEGRHQVTMQEISKRFAVLFETSFVKENNIRPQQSQVPKDADRLLAVYQNIQAMEAEEAARVDDIWELDLPERWALYKHWVHAYKSDVRGRVWELAQEFERVNDLLKERLLEEDFFITSSSYVVGMTTTAAAKCHDLLQKLKPRIVILEEAAEVLEGHVITTLTSECEHLILIGDHQQLKPNPTVYELATKYNLNVSLFERMIKNGVEHVVLEEQRRMRPEIAVLLHDIYPKLKNADCVKDYADIQGIEQNVYLVNHEERECRANDSVSIRNQHESEFIVRLCGYLLLQGCYSAAQITILTPYSGQLHSLRQLMSKEIFRGVRVCTVDNFQGEENDIILLSLVRSNDDRKLGFLAEDNRVCVALSRAKQGFYCIGDFEMLTAKSDLWNKVVSRAKKMRCYGSGLPLVCRNHPRERVLAVRAQDFERAPEGGCMEMCSFRLQCGHVCGRACHAYDMKHEKVRCLQPCALELCDRGHRCPRRCFEDCGPCKAKVAVTFDCGHKAMVSCPEVEGAECREPCQVLLSCGHPCKENCGQKHTQRCLVKESRTLACGHSARVPCYMASFTCKKDCNAKLPCGHTCSGTCGSCRQGSDHIPCTAPCTAILVCGHTCTESCSDPCPACKKQCAKECSHSACQHDCGTRCIPCKEPCTWACKHLKCSRLCDEVCDRQRCDAACDQLLSCGHACVGVCGEPCPSVCRVCNKARFVKYQARQRFIQLACGHFFEVREMDLWMDSEADHIRPKTCPDCAAPILRSLRYGDVVRAIHSAIEKVKCELSAVSCTSFLTEKVLEILKSPSSSLLVFRSKNLQELYLRAREESESIRSMDFASANVVHRINYIVMAHHVLSLKKKSSIISRREKIDDLQLQECLDILLKVTPEHITSEDVDSLFQEINPLLKKLDADEIHPMKSADLQLTNRLSYRSGFWKLQGSEVVPAQAVASAAASASASASNWLSDIPPLGYNLTTDSDSDEYLF